MLCDSRDICCGDVTHVQKDAEKKWTIVQSVNV